jgi:hypothetical protein
LLKIAEFDDPPWEAIEEETILRETQANRNSAISQDNVPPEMRTTGNVFPREESTAIYLREFKDSLLRHATS